MMRLERVEISNFRAIRKANIRLSDYTCFVGQNGAGKSTVLNALNIFFRQTSNTGTNLQVLDQEDFHCHNVAEPIVIRVTFADLSEEAEREFSHYARGGKLIITAKAEYDANSATATVLHFGERMAMTEFAPFFEAESRGEKVAALNPIYEALQERFPDLEKASSKDAKIAALRKFEAERPDLCTPIPSADQFYGVSKGTNKLEKFIQWVYVPAVKDAIDEQAEQKNGALGKLLARAVRAKTNFSDDIEAIKARAQDDYKKLLESNKPALKGISESLNARLAQWAHKGVQLDLNWEEDRERSIRIEEPAARVRVTEGDFSGQLARLGHGLQRSYLIALLQELAVFDLTDAPRLVLAIEEPELYQHPPQARHLADVLAQLSEDSAQVIVCSHSPYFVAGSLFEDVKVVQTVPGAEGCKIFESTAECIAERIGRALDKPFQPPSATRAKLHQILQPQIAELFFSSKVIFVEGREDVAYIKSYFQLNGIWDHIRSFGCHFVPVDKKSELLRPLIVAQEMGIKSYTIFDADGDETNEHRRGQHLRDNQGLMRALGLDAENPFPTDAIHCADATIWPTNLGAEIKQTVGVDAWNEAKSEAAQSFEFGSSLTKNVLFIAELLAILHRDHIKPKPLQDVSQQILQFAEA